MIICGTFKKYDFIHFQDIVLEASIYYMREVYSWAPPGLLLASCGGGGGGVSSNNTSGGDGANPSNKADQYVNTVIPSDGSEMNYGASPLFLSAIRA